MSSLPKPNPVTEERLKDQGHFFSVPLAHWTDLQHCELCGQTYRLTKTLLGEPAALPLNQDGSPLGPVELAKVT